MPSCSGDPGLWCGCRLKPAWLQLCLMRAHTSLLVQLVKLCSGMIEAGKAYITTNKHFVSGVRDLSQQCKKDEMISVSYPVGWSMGHTEGWGVLSFLMLCMDRMSKTLVLFK